MDNVKIVSNLLQSETYIHKLNMDKVSCFSTRSASSTFSTIHFVLADLTHSHTTFWTLTIDINTNLLYGLTMAKVTIRQRHLYVVLL